MTAGVTGPGTTDPTERASAAALDDDWVRPLPEHWLRTDGLVALAFFAASAVFLELARSAGGLGIVELPLVAQYALLASAAVLLVIRRRAPIAAGLLSTAHLLVASSLAPMIAAQFSLQVLYFCAVYSAVAWARDRRLLVGAGTLALGSVALWSVWDFTVGAGLQRIADARSDVDLDSTGLLPPIPAYLLLYSLINVVFFVGAAALGRAAWRAAREREVTLAQSRTIAEQAESLRERAVVDERLRIARELHDVVAHHVAAIGVQAGAARTVLPTDPDRAAQALRTVEGSAREAVTEMRTLLGTLRAGVGGVGGDGSAGGDGVSGEPPSRTSEPGLAQLDALVDAVRTPGFAATVDASAADPDELAEVPGPVGLSLYRTVQEALANVRRHSTATAARVALRTGGGDGGRWVEVEVTDDGRPRPGTSGTGLGLLGMRERVRSHRGTCEIGPRVTGGYRVRVRLPYGGAR